MLTLRLGLRRRLLRRPRQFGHGGHDRMVRRFVRESAAMTSNSWLKVGQSWIVKTVWMKRRPVPMYDSYATPDDPYARPKHYRGVSNAHEDQAVS